MFSKPSVTDVTTTHRKSLEKLDEEYEKNKRTLIQSFSIQLKAMLSDKVGKLQELKTKLTKIANKVDNEEKDIQLLKESIEETEKLL